MKKSIVGLLASIMTVSALSSIALAAPGKKPAPVKADTLKCPSCSMPMPTKKTATFSVPVVVGKKTYYCCSACPSGKKAAAAAAAAKPKMKK